ncbi:hypothetical protein D3C72_1886360 [compost metagenome]
MVAARLAASMLFGDQRAKHAAHLFQRRRVVDGALEHDDAGAIHQRLPPFCLQRAQRRSTGGQRTHLVAVVDEDIVFHRSGVRIVGQRGALADGADEIIEPAILLRQPERGGRRGVLGDHAVSPDVLSCRISIGMKIRIFHQKIHQKTINGMGMA